jgi:TolB-like protein/Tfp pilus assembly protein PilF
LVIAILAVLATLKVGGLRDRLRSNPTGPAIRSLAVLPLENLSNDPEQEYFADGMTEELVTELGKISALRVISRTSVMCYKRTKEPLPQIARELGVEALVEGTVLRTQDRVRVTANLVQASPEKHLWAQEYERALPDILGLQGDIASEIAHQIQATVTPAERSEILNKRPASATAYEAYLKGRFHWNKRTERELRVGISYFNQAIEADPRYALAYVGLADSYNILGASEFTAVTQEEAKAKAMTYVRKALEIDDGLGEAHTSLAFLKWHYDWDRKGAEQEFKRAIALSPNYANAYHWYAEMLANERRFDESIAESYQAKDLDPLAPMITASIADRLLLAGRTEQALREVNSALELDPSIPWAHVTLATVYRGQRRFGEAIDESKKAVQLSDNNPNFLADLGYMYAIAGDSAGARGILKDLQKMAGKQYVSPYETALIYAGLGEKDKALGALNQAFTERSPSMNYLNTETRFDNLRTEPGFKRLLKGAGFEDP